MKKFIVSYGRVHLGIKRRGTAVGNNPEPAKIIRLVFELALQDYSTLMIANELNERGIPTPGKFRNAEKKKYCLEQKSSR